MIGAPCPHPSTPLVRSKSGVMRIGPECCYSSRNVFFTAKADTLMQFYLAPKEPMALDFSLLLHADTAFSAKQRHIEQVMFALYSNDEMAEYDHGLHGLSDPALKHLLEMLDPHTSPLYDMKELAYYLRRPDAEANPVDLILHLTMSKKTDEEICRRLSLVLYKLSTQKELDVGQRGLLREIKMYAKTMGLVHLKHLLALFPALSL
ncbi:hypothetical protein HDU98_003282 [Podochytrium sp. JEL0797]|nr:hypothetical protein HDU98_003282 [Podochytrium sp. JEL0797]